MNFRYPTKTRQFVCNIVSLQSKSVVNFLSSCKQYLLSGHDNGEIHVWKYVECTEDWILNDINTNDCLELVKTLTTASETCKTGSVLSITTWERHGRKFVINATSNGVVFFWNNVPDKAPLSLCHKGKGHGNHINALTVWNDWLVTGSSDNTIKVWNMELTIMNQTNDNAKEGSIQIVKLAKMLAGHFGSVHATIAFEKYLWTGGRDRTIRIWNHTFKSVNVIKAHKGTISSLCEWRHHVASGSYDKTIKIWNREGKNIKTFLGHQCWINCLCVWNDRLCSGSKDRTIRIWNWNGDCVSMITEEESVKSLYVWNDALWSSCGNSIKCWKAKVSWNVLRVLWIGLMKNTPRDCPVAALPNEILKEIISALFS